MIPAATPRQPALHERPRRNCAAPVSRSPRRGFACWTSSRPVPTRHLTAEDVYRRLLDEHADIGLATVYRVLTQFEQAGLLVRHHFEGGKAVYELNEGKHHDHLVCLQCGKVEEFYDPEIEKRQARIARDRGFAVHDHSLYLYADCLRVDCPDRPKNG